MYVSLKIFKFLNVAFCSEKETSELFIKVKPAVEAGRYLDNIAGLVDKYSPATKTHNCKVERLKI